MTDHKLYCDGPCDAGGVGMLYCPQTSAWEFTKEIYDEADICKCCKLFQFFVQIKRCSIMWDSTGYVVVCFKSCSIVNFCLHYAIGYLDGYWTALYRRIGCFRATYKAVERPSAHKKGEKENEENAGGYCNPCSHYLLNANPCKDQLYETTDFRSFCSKLIFLLNELSSGQLHVLC